MDRITKLGMLKTFTRGYEFNCGLVAAVTSLLGVKMGARFGFTLGLPLYATLYSVGFGTKVGLCMTTESLDRLL